MEMSDNLAQASQFNSNEVGSVSPSYVKPAMQPMYTKPRGSRLYQAATAGLMGNTAGVKPTGAPMPFNPNQQNTIKSVFGSQVPGTFDMDINPDLGNINL